MQQKCTFSLITQDKTEVVVPPDFVDQSDMLSDYAKMQRQNNGDAEELQAKFEMTNEMPLISKFHLEMIFEFLGTYREEKQKENEGAADEKQTTKSGERTAEATAEESAELSTMPKWAFDLFDKLPKNDLFLAMNAANYFGIAPFVSLSAAFVCFQILQKKGAREVAEYLNMDENDNNNNGK
ncbi:hypothetical protein niasHS_000593 [Heterodera schachtii]|uniref:Uncharacterized protein n=1 Tax=Heterodera schachtii TaxID=97005 RepID=A0ABD2K4W1_HETSC